MIFCAEIPQIHRIMARVCSKPNREATPLPNVYPPTPFYKPQPISQTSKKICSNFKTVNWFISEKKYIYVSVKECTCRTSHCTKLAWTLQKLPQKYVHYGNSD